MPPGQKLSEQMAPVTEVLLSRRLVEHDASLATEAGRVHNRDVGAPPGPEGKRLSSPEWLGKGENDIARAWLKDAHGIRHAAMPWIAHAAWCRKSTACSRQPAHKPVEQVP